MSNLVVASNPAEMVKGQLSLIDWVEGKINSIAVEFTDMEQAMNRAIKSKWSHKPLARQLNRIAKRLTYYDKVLAALKAGYFVVPVSNRDWDLDIFARRTDRKGPKQLVHRYREKAHSGAVVMRALPEGEGKYVSGNKAKITTWEEQEDVVNYKEEKTGTTMVKYHQAEEFTDVEFPLVAIDPKTMELTATAMEHKIFDEIALATDSGGDPYIIGRIWCVIRKRPINFMIAWFLDPEAI